MKASSPASFRKAVAFSLIMIPVLGILGLIGAVFVKFSDSQQPADKDSGRIGHLPQGQSGPTTHPNLKIYNSILIALERQKQEILAVERKILQHEESLPWESGALAELQQRIDESTRAIQGMGEELSNLINWIRDYEQLKEEACRAYEEGIAFDPKKQEYVQFMIRGEPVPPHCKDAALDPGVQRYVGICRKLLLDRYSQVGHIENEINGSMRDVFTMLKKIRMIRSGLRDKDPVRGEAARALPAPPSAQDEARAEVDAEARKRLDDEKQKVFQAKARADELVIQGVTLFREVIEGMKNPPQDPDQRKALLKKKEEAVASLHNAKESYGRVPPGTDPGIEERFKKIDRLIALLETYTNRLRN